MFSKTYTTDFFANPNPQDIILRSYQEESEEALRQGTRAGITNQVLCAPTGSGKSVVATDLLKKCLAKDKRAIFIAERISLVNQFSLMLDFYGVSHGVIQSDHPRRFPEERIQVASAQTLQRREWPQTDLIIVDEAHVMMKVVLDRLATKSCPAIGLTATPFSRGMGRYYGGLINVRTTNQLTAEGFLCPFRVWAAVEPDMRGVKTVAGEWVEGETSERAQKITGCAVKEYMQHGNGGKALIFGVDVAHCEKLASDFLQAGIGAALYTYREGDDVRAARMKEFRKPDSQIRALISVSALSRGLDVPDCMVCIMCRPLRSSLAEHIQILGRVLRPFPGKEHAIILDLAGNFVRHYDATRDFFENGATELDDGKKKEGSEKKPDERKPKKCPQCFCVWDKGNECPSCGFVFRTISRTKHEQGELGEFDLKSKRIVHPRSLYIGDILQKYNPAHKPASPAFERYIRSLGIIIGKGPFSAMQLMKIKLRYESKQKQHA